MKFSFRLAELINHVPDPKRRPGTIKAICDHTGLDRHQVAALLKNEVKYIPLKALSRLCDYLVQHENVDPARLPGALFGVEPERFWELLARRRRMELVIGVRRAADLPEQAWIMAPDSVLLGSVLGGVSSLGGTGEYLESEQEESVEKAPPQQPVAWSQRLVWGPKRASSSDDLAPEEIIGKAAKIYNDFSEERGDRALICLGSVKSNPVVEVVLASAFGCDPFAEQDDVAKPAERGVPLFFRYRDYDPHPASCSGGLALSAADRDSQPGIHYEQKGGRWAVAPWDKDRHDAAMVFYVHRESQGRLEMVLGGYSGRATRLLARTLEHRSGEFWPPNFERQGLQIGAFVIAYDIQSGGEDFDPLGDPPEAVQKVIPLDESVIARRLEV